MKKVIAILGRRKILLILAKLTKYINDDKMIYVNRNAKLQYLK